jgi:uncharacterized protein (DUF362 family)/Pyruvate/2-oxoacid:ferredoxin oxidoreductase delta subunit
MDERSQGDRTRSVVALVRCSSYEPEKVQAAVDRGIELLGGIERFASPGETILLKPNLLVAREPERAVTTHPTVFGAVARRFVDAGAVVTYGDSPGFGRPLSVARRAGLASIAEGLGVRLADFSHGRTVSIPEGGLIKRFTIAEGALAADGIVSLPKLKSHGLTRITGAMKNQYGCVPGTLKAEFHARLPNVDLFSRMLADLNRLLRPRLVVMDGIVAMEGNGPQNGTPRPLNVLLFSADPVALDAAVCRIVNLDPTLVLPIVYGEETGLGRASGIETVGDPIDSFSAPDFDVNRRRSSTTGGPSRYSRLARRFVVPRPLVVPQKCTECGTCIEVCPVSPKAVAFEDEKRSRPPVHRYDRCIRCYCCQEMCPEGAIELRVPLLGRAIHRN